MEFNNRFYFKSDLFPFLEMRFHFYNFLFNWRGQPPNDRALTGRLLKCVKIGAVIILNVAASDWSAEKMASRCAES